ncbi:methylenetetrahydrofolate reductase [Candidatus Poriferisodalis sp.]|uniref:methylenetetrahydrofolate reductase n=1 Tax=Candidatus Poriferisodalis sp. TaxID=3101277 RepID=UPI003B0187BA
MSLLAFFTSNRTPSWLSAWRPAKPLAGCGSLRRRRPLTGDDAAARRRLLDHAQWELIPLRNLADQLPHLPSDSPVSVTASASKTLEDTLDLTAELCVLGHRPVPHLAARMIHSRAHLEELLGRIASLGLSEIFLVGGDLPSPAGPFDSAAGLLEALRDVEHSLTHIGVTSYPEGHALISDAVLHEALHRKQALLNEAGIAGHAATQMCFHARSIIEWLQSERDSGLVLPVHLGMPGAVDPARLLSISTRLGIGASLRYLRKNTGAVARMLRPGGYDPSGLVDLLAPHANRLDITGLHVFTFNSIADTVAWRDNAVQGSR